MITILIGLVVGFIIGASRERVLNKNYNKTQVSAYLLDMANYVSTKELRDNFETDYVSWERKVNYFKNYLLNLAKKR